MRILIADDDEIMRESLRVMVEREPGWEVCAVAENSRQAVDLVKKLKPDAIILDLEMPAPDGVDALKKIKWAVPQTEILVFGAHESESVIAEVFAAGAKSYMRKADAGRHLISALRSLQEHKPFFTDDVSEVLFSRFLAGSKPEPAASEKLSARERQIVRLLAEGKSNKENALALGVSIRTIETHRATIMRKLGVGSFADLVRYAIRNGIVEA